MTGPEVHVPDPILVIDSVTKRFGGLTAVDVEHLEIGRNTITALIGPNGAGKTTLFNLLTGFDQADTGTWTLDGTRIEHLPSHRIARLGMVRTFQLTKVLSGMTVLENMLLAADDQPGEHFFTSLVPGLWRRREREVQERAEELLAQVGLAAKADDLAGTMSGGQRKLLELARVLMLDPSVVMLDEPMAGVNPALTESLLEHVSGLRDQGRTVVFVEHDMDVVHRISDRVVVLAEGSVIAAGTPAEVTANQEVIDAYLGQSDGAAR
jgi:neutral amino acid transport system ATP-binding protein